MSKMLTLAALLSLAFLSGCTAVVIREPAHREPVHIKVMPYCPPPASEYQPVKPPVGPDTGASLYFFRFCW